MACRSASTARALVAAGAQAAAAAAPQVRRVRRAAGLRRRHQHHRRLQCAGARARRLGARFDFASPARADRGADDAGRAPAVAAAAFVDLRRRSGPLPRLALPRLPRSPAACRLLCAARQPAQPPRDRARLPAGLRFGARGGGDRQRLLPARAALPRRLAGSGRPRVRVRLLLQGQPEYALQFHAQRALYGQLLAAHRDPRIRGQLLHAKVAMVDERWATWLVEHRPVLAAAGPRGQRGGPRQRLREAARRRARRGDRGQFAPRGAGRLRSRGWFARAATGAPISSCAWRPWCWPAAATTDPEDPAVPDFPVRNPHGRMGLPRPAAPRLATRARARATKRETPR